MHDRKQEAAFAQVNLAFHRTSKIAAKLERLLREVRQCVDDTEKLRADLEQLRNKMPGARLVPPGSPPDQVAPVLAELAGSSRSNKGKS